MGSVILGKVISALNIAGFPAERAYPGRPFPAITGPVAAVHLQGVDSTTMTATVEVELRCPASYGGTACEEAALEVLRTLWSLGAACSQSGCRYDRISGTFCVPITAAFTQVVPSSGEEEPVPVLPGFWVSIDGVAQPNGVSFQAKLETGAEAEYVAAQPVAVASHGGRLRWSIVFEEQLPVGTREPESPEGAFTLTVENGAGVWRYTGCRWTTVRRVYTNQGLHRVREGFALSREEVQDGESEV